MKWQEVDSMEKKLKDQLHQQKNLHGLAKFLYPHWQDQFLLDFLKQSRFQIDSIISKSRT